MTFFLKCLQVLKDPALGGNLITVPPAPQHHWKESEIKFYGIIPLPVFYLLSFFRVWGEDLDKWRDVCLVKNSFY
jgi:hypothetical protein